jgi:hypothetical protein
MTSVIRQAYVVPITMVVASLLLATLPAHWSSTSTPFSQASGPPVFTIQRRYVALLLLVQRQVLALFSPGKAPSGGAWEFNCSSDRRFFVRPSWNSIDCFKDARAGGDYGMS